MKTRSDRILRSYPSVAAERPDEPERANTQQSENVSLTLMDIGDNPVDIACPGCGKVIRRYTKEAEHGLTSTRPYLRDGDTIPGVWSALSESQREPCGFDYALYIGSQPCCERVYCVIQIRLVAASVADVHGVVEHWFETHFERAPRTHHLVNTNGGHTSGLRRWIVTEAQTDCGVAHEHLIGPFPLDASIEGRYGVCACGAGADIWNEAKDLVVRVWDDLRELLRRRNIAISAAARRVHQIERRRAPGADRHA